jgi:hypothetical protein
VSAQSDKEIAGIYLVKAEEKLKENAISQAVIYFDKANTLYGGDTTLKVEELGTLLYFELKDYQKSKEHAKRYFTLATDKKSERYQEVLYLYVEIEELIEVQNKIAVQEEKERLLKEKEENRLEALKKEWKEKAASLVFEADSIYEFDKNGVAPFKSSKGKYGVVDAMGNTVITSNYSSFLCYDGYIVLLEGVAGQPTEIVVYNSRTKIQKTLPPVSNFNPLSTNYGKVMLPRDNNILITYPNNSNKVAVYDLSTNSLKINSSLINHFKYWKDLKVIKKYNKENQIKINKEYLSFGGDLVGFSAFYHSTANLFGFISVSGSIVSSNSYNYLGTLCNGFVEAIKSDGTHVWLNENGKETKALVNKNGLYEGTNELIKIGDSKYQFRNKENQVIKGEDILDDLESFLKKN